MKICNKKKKLIISKKTNLDLKQGYKLRDLINIKILSFY